MFQTKNGFKREVKGDVSGGKKVLSREVKEEVLENAASKER